MTDLKREDVARVCDVCGCALGPHRYWHWPEDCRAALKALEKEQGRG